MQISSRSEKTASMLVLLNLSSSSVLSLQDKSSKKVLRSSTNEVIRKIIRYGEFCQLTMDSVDLNP
jgi:hypothetical protein